MKRIVPALLVIAMLLCMSACGNATPVSSTESDVPVEQSVEAKDEPVAEAKDEPVAEASDEPVAEASDEPAAEASDEPAAEANDEPISESGLDYSIRPEVLDDEGFCVTYDEMCEHLLALIRGDYPCFKIGLFDKMPSAEFRDHVEHIDEETAEKYAHRFLFVDGEYTGVFVGATSKDDMSVTGDSAFDHFSVDCDKYVDIDENTARFIVVSRALLYLVDMTDDYSYSLDALKFFMEKPDTIRGLGESNPLVGVLLSDPLELALSQKNSL